MNFKEFLSESQQRVSDKDEKIATDIENFLKKTLSQKFLDNILNNAIKDKVLSKTSAPLEKFGKSDIKLTKLVVIPAGQNIGGKGRISVDVEVSSLQSPDKSFVRSNEDYKKIELFRKNIRSQVANELAKVLKKQVSAKAKVYEVSKNVYAEGIFVALSYQ